MAYDYLDAWEGLITRTIPNIQLTAVSVSNQYQLTEEKGGQTTLYVTAPGYKREDLSIEMHEGRLSIAGTPSIAPQTALVLPRIDLCFVVRHDFLVQGADYKDGLLAVHLVRQKAKTDAVKIPINIE